MASRSYKKFLIPILIVFLITFLCFLCFSTDTDRKNVKFDVEQKSEVVKNKKLKKNEAEDQNELEANQGDSEKMISHEIYDDSNISKSSTKTTIFDDEEKNAAKKKLCERENPNIESDIYDRIEKPSSGFDEDTPFVQRGSQTNDKKIWQSGDKYQQSSSSNIVPLLAKANDTRKKYLNKSDDKKQLSNNREISSNTPIYTLINAINIYAEFSDTFLYGVMICGHENGTSITDLEFMYLKRYVYTKKFQEFFNFDQNVFLTLFKSFTAANEYIMLFDRNIFSNRGIIDEIRHVNIGPLKSMVLGYVYETLRRNQNFAEILNVMRFRDISKLSVALSKCFQLTFITFLPSENDVPKIREFDLMNSSEIMNELQKVFFDHLTNIYVQKTHTRHINIDILNHRNQCKDFQKRISILITWEILSQLFEEYPLHNGICLFHRNIRLFAIEVDFLRLKFTRIICSLNEIQEISLKDGVCLSGLETKKLEEKIERLNNSYIKFIERMAACFNRLRILETKINNNYSNTHG